MAPSTFGLNSYIYIYTYIHICMPVLSRIAACVDMFIKSIPTELLLGLFACSARCDKRVSGEAC